MVGMKGPRGPKKARGKGAEFVRDESGAVTTDYVVLAMGLAAVSMTVLTNISDGAAGASDKIAADLAKNSAISGPRASGSGSGSRSYSSGGDWGFTPNGGGESRNGGDAPASGNEEAGGGQGQDAPAPPAGGSEPESGAPADGPGPDQGGSDPSSDAPAAADPGDGDAAQNSNDRNDGGSGNPPPQRPGNDDDDDDEEDDEDDEEDEDEEEEIGPNDFAGMARFLGDLPNGQLSQGDRNFVNSVPRRLRDDDFGRNHQNRLRSIFERHR
jgi:Flp pilus assembly pilin Flp